MITGDERLFSVDVVEVSARAVFGATNGNAQAGARRFALDTNNTVFAMSAAAGVTARLSRTFAYRIAQPEVFITRLGDATQTSFRVSTGIAFVYGR